MSRNSPHFTVLQNISPVHSLLDIHHQQQNGLNPEELVKNMGDNQGTSKKWIKKRKKQHIGEMSRKSSQFTFLQNISLVHSVMDIHHHR